MGSKRTVITLVALAILTFISVTSPSVSAQKPISVSLGATKSPDCFAAILNMSDCLSYVVAGSKLTAPDAGCCGSLAGLVESSPICLCQFLGNPSSLGIKLDAERAVNLPKVCKVDTPPVSLCAASRIPIPGDISPAASEGPISPGPGPGPESVSSIAPDTMPPSSEDGNNGHSSTTRNSINIFIAGISATIFITFFL